MKECIRTVESKVKKIFNMEGRDDHEFLPLAEELLITDNFQKGRRKLSFFKNTFPRGNSFFNSYP